MVSILSSNAGDGSIPIWVKSKEIGICCFCVKHSEFRTRRRVDLESEYCVLTERHVCMWTVVSVSLHCKHPTEHTG